MGLWSLEIALGQIGQQRDRRGGVGRGEQAVSGRLPRKWWVGKQATGNGPASRIPSSTPYSGIPSLQPPDYLSRPRIRRQDSLAPLWPNGDDLSPATIPPPPLCPFPFSPFLSSHTHIYPVSIIVSEPSPISGFCMTQFAIRLI